MGTVTLLRGRKSRLFSQLQPTLPSLKLRVLFLAAGQSQ